jgi:hypothetical protein
MIKAKKIMLIDKITYWEDVDYDIDHPRNILYIKKRDKPGEFHHKVPLTSVLFIDDL